MEPTLNPESGFLRLRLDFAYDGTQYYGWARQPGHRTIQSEIEGALGSIFNFTPNVVTAGRTDAGVHATGAVAHVDVPDREFDVDNLAYRINRILDEDIRIRKVSRANPYFHARYSASARHYQYKLADASRELSPLERLDIAPWYRHLDLEILNQASALLLGEHDFAAFCKFRKNATTFRNLTRFDWVRREDGILIGSISADAFCYNMVRNLVGGVASVAEGRFDTQWILSVLEGKIRVAELNVFPSRGLTLVGVDYPPDDQLASQAAKVMSTRTFTSESAVNDESGDSDEQ